MLKYRYIQLEWASGMYWGVLEDSSVSHRSGSGSGRAMELRKMGRLLGGYDRMFFFSWLFFVIVFCFLFCVLFRLCLVVFELILLALVGLLN